MQVESTWLVLYGLIMMGIGFSFGSLSKKYQEPDKKHSNEENYP